MLSFIDRSKTQVSGSQAADGASSIVEISIPRDTCITGSIETKHKVRLEGQIYGPITSFGVVVENEATVEGEINATEIVIRGRVKGPLRAKHVYLYSSGEVDGDMVVSSMVIEDGARCLGNIKQEKYGVAKPIIKRVVTIDGDYPTITDGDVRLNALFAETAEKMGPGATYRDVAEKLMKGY
jgi:cytoskeletal protein CcmA (bactofilin family)